MQKGRWYVRGKCAGVAGVRNNAAVLLFEAHAKAQDTHATDLPAQQVESCQVPNTGALVGATVMSLAQQHECEPCVVSHLSA